MQKMPWMDEDALSNIRDLEVALKEFKEQGKWTLIAPDGRVWSNTLQLVSAAALAELGGYLNEPFAFERKKDYGEL